MTLFRYGILPSVIAIGVDCGFDMDVHLTESDSDKNRRMALIDKVKDDYRRACVFKEISWERTMSVALNLEGVGALQSRVMTQGANHDI